MFATDFNSLSKENVEQLDNIAWYCYQVVRSYSRKLTKAALGLQDT